MSPWVYIPLLIVWSVVCVIVGAAMVCWALFGPVADEGGDE